MIPTRMELVFPVEGFLTTEVLQEIAQSISDHQYTVSGPEKITHMYWDQSDNIITVELADD